MKAEQKIVAVGATTGVLTMALSVWLLTNALPAPTMTDALFFFARSQGERATG
jgi:hypothetical protein